jgi:hypothetical protein
MFFLQLLQEKFHYTDAPGDKQANSSKHGSQEVIGTYALRLTFKT